MIGFLATHWWIWIVIVGTLLYLTAKNNKKLRERGLEPPKKDNKYKQALSRKKQSYVRKMASKLGLSGLFNYIFPKK